jgi:pimeloyl-ACP methyl ester carboxylesterase
VSKGAKQTQSSPADPATEWVELDWCERRVRIEHQWLRRHDAQAPLMVFLHEGLGALGMWRDFPAALCEVLACRGLVYSRPGYGHSTPRASSERWTPDFMHRQAYEVLPALLAALNIDFIRDKLWLFGHSDGGSIALLFAARFSPEVNAAIVLAPHVMVEDISVNSIEQTRKAYLETDLRTKLARHHADPDSAFWGWNDIWLHPDFRAWRIDQELASITCPVLAVQGLNDEYGTLDQVRLIAQKTHKSPACQVVELADCGHSPHRDQRDLLIQHVHEFFRQNAKG